jgi:hypothetical protein
MYVTAEANRSLPIRIKERPTRAVERERRTRVVERRTASDSLC